MNSLEYGRFWLDIMEAFLFHSLFCKENHTVGRTVGPVPRDIVCSLHLELLKVHLNRALSNLFLLAMLWAPV